MRASLRPSRAGPTARLLLAFATLAIAISAAGGAGAAEPIEPQAQAPEAVPGQALVRFKPGTPETLKRAAHARVGAAVLRRTEAIGYELISFPAHLSRDAVLASYRSDPNVAAVEPNLVGRIALSPGDACFVEPCAGVRGQWHLKMINAAFGWDAAPGRVFTAAEKKATAPVTVAVLDTKIDASHPDFANPGGGTDAREGGQLDLADARDWVPASAQGGWAAYHGTFVAGLAAAAAGNGRGVAGVGYAARVMPLTVVDGSGRTDAASLADAIVYAWQRGARIINLSLGLGADSAAVRDAIVKVTRGSATAPPALVVAAAGNNTAGAPFYPGSYPEVMSVSGTDAADRRAGCSNYNANVSVSAPADRLVGLAPMPGEALQAPCGTSAAAPQVAGLAALLFAQDSSRTPAQVRRIIEQSADDLGTPGRDDFFGHGRINLERALRGAGPSTVRARATIPPATGGASTVTATATSSQGVQRAELILDRPDAQPIAMTAADGAFGGTSEALRASVSVPSGMAAGPHPMWVRAYDGASWGPATAGVLLVDRTKPGIQGATASYGVRATRQPVRVTFSIADDYSSAFNYGVQFISTATGKVVFQDARVGVGAGRQTYDWLPGLEVPGGHFGVNIIVFDQAGNVANVFIGTLVT